MNETGKRLEGYKRLVAIARDLASTLDLDTLLNRILRAAVDIMEGQAASILLYEDGTHLLMFQVSTDLELQALRGVNIPLDRSLAGWIVTNRQPVRIANAHLDPRFFKQIEQSTSFPTRSFLGVPLINKDRIVGVLEVINKRTSVFSKADEDQLLVLGAQAAVAIENARLFQQTDLIAEFVHELRTPLASIGTATYLLLRPEMAPEQREQMIRNIHDETMRLNTLASSFLDLARLESGRVQFHLTEFSLQPVLEECQQTMQGLAGESQVQIKLEVPTDFPPVKADRDKIKQLVLNLVSNAIKYNRSQGTVTITAALGEDEWTLAVRDTGMGLPASDIPHLFEKFYRMQASAGKVQGTGLGLSICKQIVSGHGGSITVNSVLGEGTTFTVHFPIQKK